VNELQKIYDEMVANFNAAAALVLEKIAAIRNAADTASGTDQEVRAIYVEQIEAAEADVTGLEPAFNELIEYKLNLRVKQTVEKVRTELDLLQIHLRHVLQAKDNKIATKVRQARIAGYNAKALPFVQEAEAFDAFAPPVAIEGR
jgi:uncharacterized Ntn-hydrolase superfamily protein